jgi:hypothetical protein
MLLNHSRQLRCLDVRPHVHAPAPLPIRIAALTPADAPLIDAEILFGTAAM